MNKDMGLNLKINAAHISSLKKSPVAIVQEYATNNCIVPQYNLIHNGISFTKVSFKYSLSMGDYVTVGEGPSKKEAKHVAASNLLKLMINDNPQLLNTDFKQWDFDNRVVSPFDNSIKVNAVGKLIEICRINVLGLPKFNLAKEEGQSHAKLFSISCQVAEMIETAIHKTKKQAKHLAAVQMVNRIMSIEKSPVVEGPSQVSDSMKVVERVKLLKSKHENHLLGKRKSMHMDADLFNNHVLFKKSKFINMDTLNTVMDQYYKTGKLELSEPLEILNKIVTENEMSLTSFPVKEIFGNVGLKKCNSILVLESVYPLVIGVSEADTIEQATRNAAVQLLCTICILLK